ncbi:hypothetical protein [Kitasatospora indigofera]|uniref:hypothetical protein n=1 Tax=Kitasatospora indigofera TaxID=67307 RepID=UPI0033BC55D9
MRNPGERDRDRHTGGHGDRHGSRHATSDHLPGGAERHTGRLRLAVLGATALALGTVLLLSSCSAGAGSGRGDEVASLAAKGASSSAPAQAAAGEKGDMVKFAGCMREHGVDMPDPNADGSMPAMAARPADAAGSAEAEKMQAADEACRTWLPNGGVLSEKDKAEQRERALQLARCMREHGVDMPDPKPGEEGGLTLGSDNADKDTMEKAMQACAGGALGAATVVAP